MWICSVEDVVRQGDGVFDLTLRIGVIGLCTGI